MQLEQNLPALLSAGGRARAVNPIGTCSFQMNQEESDRWDQLSFPGPTNCGWVHSGRMADWRLMREAG